MVRVTISSVCSIRLVQHEMRRGILLYSNIARSILSVKRIHLLKGVVELQPAPLPRERLANGARANVDVRQPPRPVGTTSLQNIKKRQFRVAALYTAAWWEYILHEQSWVEGKKHQIEGTCRRRPQRGVCLAS